VIKLLSAAPQLASDPPELRLASAISDPGALAQGARLKVPRWFLTPDWDPRAAVKPSDVVCDAVVTKAKASRRTDVRISTLDPAGLTKRPRSLEIARTWAIPAALWDAWLPTFELSREGVGLGCACAVRSDPSVMVHCLGWISTNNLIAVLDRSCDPLTPLVEYNLSELLPIGYYPDAKLLRGVEQTAAAGKMVQIAIPAKARTYADLATRKGAAMGGELHEWNAQGLITGAAPGAKWFVRFNIGIPEDSVALKLSEFSVVNVPPLVPPVLPPPKSANPTVDFDVAEVPLPDEPMTSVFDLPAMVTNLRNLRDNFTKAYSEDAATAKPWHLLSKGDDSIKVSEILEIQQAGYLMKDGFLFRVVKTRTSLGQSTKRERLVVPKGMVYTLIRAFHNESSHLGAKALIAELEEHFFWDNLQPSVRNFVTCCRTCQRKRNFHRLKAEKLRRLGTRRAYAVGELWSMDIISIYPTDDGDRYVLVFTEHFSRFVVLEPMKSKDASTVAGVIFKSLICKFGCPNQLLSDQGAEFVAAANKHLAAWLGYDHITIAVGNPAGNGQVERFNKTIVEAVVKMKLDDPLAVDWTKRIAALALQFNIAFNDAIKGRPFVAFTGRAPSMPRDLVGVPFAGKELAGSPDLAVSVAEMRLAMLEAAAIARVVTAAGMVSKETKQALKELPIEFGVGAWVLVINGSSTSDTSAKLLAHAGPFQVVDRISAQDYLICGADGIPCWVSAFRLAKFEGRYSTLAGFGLAPSALGPDVRWYCPKEQERVSQALEKFFAMEPKERFARLEGLVGRDDNDDWTSGLAKEESSDFESSDE
jgi:transposase InsO family protein